MASRENDHFYLPHILYFITVQSWFITTNVGGDNPIY